MNPSKVFFDGILPRQYDQGKIVSLFRQIAKTLNNTADGFLFHVTSVTADYTVMDNDSIILVDATSAAVTVTLPPAAEAKNKRYTVKKIDSSGNAVTVSSTDTIDDATSQDILNQYDSIGVVSDGTEYWIV